MKIRPQILAAMGALMVLSGVAIIVGWRMEANEIITGAVAGGSTGITALAMKILDNE